MNRGLLLLFSAPLLLWLPGCSRSWFLRLDWLLRPRPSPMRQWELDRLAPAVRNVLEQLPTAHSNLVDHA